MVRQHGAALVVVLSMLAMSLMLGLSGMQSSQIDERLAGNYKAATEAQMRAEAAASEAFSQAQVGGGISWSGSPVFDNFNDEDIDWNSQEGAGVKAAIDGGSVCPSGSCFFIPVRISGAGNGWVLAMGAVFQGEASEVLAVSEPVFLRFASAGFGNMSPLTVANIMSFFDDPSSNAGKFDGMNTVPSMAFAAGETATVNESKNIINGEVSREGFPGAIFGDPNDASDFISFIEALESHAKEQGQYHSGNYSDGSGGGPVFGTSATPQLTFIDGSITTNNVSGSGVLVVNGDWDGAGGPDFEGLIIVLGNYKPSGGGGDAFNGSLFVAPYDLATSTFTQATVDVSGGGGLDYVYDEAALAKAFGIIGDTARDVWDSAGGAGGASSTLAEWR